MGIEPTYSAWKAEVLPLNYTRRTSLIFPYKIKHPPATKSSVNFATSHSIWWRGEDYSRHPAFHPSGQTSSVQYCSRQYCRTSYRFKSSPSGKTHLLQNQPTSYSTTFYLVEGGGFEPPKVEPADLQSAPFGRSGTPPKIKPRILLEHGHNCQP